MTPTDIVISFFERVYNQKDVDYVREIYMEALWKRILFMMYATNSI